MWSLLFLLSTAHADTYGRDPSAPSAAICPMMKCVALDCPLTQQETPKSASGCSLCPRCTGGGNKSCAAVTCLTGTTCVDGDCVREPGEKGKGVCPLFFCIPPPAYCPFPLETPIVNGCPTCPLCPCPCGKPCKMAGGGSGVCQVGGKCAVNKMAPRCPTTSSCPCGKPCTMASGGSGVCQVGGMCAVNIRPPQCPKGPCPCGKSCTMTNGGSGVCQVGGECALNILPPQCPGPCPCGKPCKMASGGSGVCQVGGECAVNIQRPQCPTSSCALILCAPNTKCINGQCVPLTTGCETVRCTSTTTCVLGACVPNPGTCKCGDPCKTKKNKAGHCQANGLCKGGKNVPQCG
jgi:hypothetical protein